MGEGAPGDAHIDFCTSGLKSWTAGLLSSRDGLSEEPGHQLTLPPFVGFPPGINPSGGQFVESSPTSEELNHWPAAATELTTQYET